MFLPSFCVSMSSYHFSRQAFRSLQSDSVTFTSNIKRIKMDLTAYAIQLFLQLDTLNVVLSKNVLFEEKLKNIIENGRSIGNIQFGVLQRVIHTVQSQNQLGEEQYL